MAQPEFSTCSTLKAGHWRAAAAVMGVTLIGWPALAEPTRGGRIEFEVFRGNEPFGKQSVTVTQVKDDFVVETAAELKATLGPIVLFSYRQDCREQWRKTALLGLDCTTRRDGKTTKVKSSPSSDGLQVSGAKKGPITFPAGTSPSTWWTKPGLGVYELINTETGERMPVNVTSLGKEMIKAGGASVEAEHIRVKGSLTVDLWYDEAGHWINCAFSASGQNMTYRLLTPIAQGPS